MSVRRISKDAILLALLCVTGMFSLPLGDNIKVSLQLLTLFIIWGIVDDIWDRILIPALYLLIGLFIPVYAGFQAGITPTFGFVISFSIATIPFHFVYKYLKMNDIARYVLACFFALIIVYIIGTIFLKFYLNLDWGKALMVAVIPYIPFDISKIAICTVIMNALPDKIKNPKLLKDQTTISETK